MAFDSLIRTRQLNKPELSGYVVDIILQYLASGTVTGIATNTGQLTGRFYPLASNPSGYQTTGDITGFATKAEMSGNNISLLATVETDYYPRTNPSGFIGPSGLVDYLAATGRTFGVSESFELGEASEAVLQFTPDEIWQLNAIGGSPALIQMLGGFQPGQEPYISGFNLYTTNINGQIPIGSGQVNSLFISKDYVDTGQNLWFNYLKLVNANTSLPGNFVFNPSGYALKGYYEGAPSTDCMIDLYGASSGQLTSITRTVKRPFIVGFDITGLNITSNGYRVLTTYDGTGYATKQNLLATSGALDDKIWNMRTDLVDYVTGTSGLYQFTGAGNVVVIQSGVHLTISGSGTNGTVTDGTYVRTTGYQVISGEKAFYDNYDVMRFNTAYGTMYDSYAVPSIHWGSRLLMDESNSVSLDWTQYLLKTDGGLTRVDWNTGLLYDVNGTESLDWLHRMLSGTWSVGGITISGQRPLTGAYIASRGPQSFTGNLTIVSGGITISGKPATTGGPYYPLGRNPSGYLTAIDILTPADEFDPVYFQVFTGTTLPPISQITVLDNGVLNGVGEYRYIFQVQGWKTGTLGRKVYSRITTSGYYDNPGDRNMEIDWLALDGVPNNQYILTQWTQPYGGGGAYGPFPTGAWTTGTWSVSATIYSGITGFVWTSGTTGTSPIGALGNWTTFTGTGLFYPSSNPSGFITSTQTGGFITSGQTGNFITAAQTGIFVTTGNTGSFITTSQTGVFSTTGHLHTGYITTGAADIRYALANGTGSFVVSGNTGNFVVTGDSRALQHLGFNKFGQFVQQTASQNNLQTYFYPNVATLTVMADTVTGAYVLNTPIPRTGNTLVYVNIKGQNLKTPYQIENSFISAYAYAGNTGLDGISGSTWFACSIIDLSNNGRTKTVGINKSGYFAIAISTTGTVAYWDRYTADVWASFGTSSFVNTGWNWTVETGLNYEFKDWTILSSGTSFVRPSQTGSFVTTSQTGAFVTTSQTGNFVTTNQTGGFVTTGNTGNFVTTSQTGSFVTTAQTGNFVTTNQTGNFITTSQTGVFVTTGQTGTFITSSQTGIFVTTGNTGNFITTSQTGIFVTTGNTGSFITTSQTGVFVTTGNTGSFITTSQTGAFSTTGHLHTGYITTGAADLRYASIATGAFLTTGAADARYALATATGSFIVSGQTGIFVTTGQTGQFYAATNPLQFISTGNADLRYAQTGQTGTFITTAQTGQFYASANPLQFISTGNADLRYATIVHLHTGYITTGAADVRYALSNATGSFITTSQTGVFVTTGQTGNFVTTSGYQTIYGEKVFYDNAGQIKLNTLVGSLYDASSVLSVDWPSRLLTDAGDNPTLDWQNCLLQANGAWTRANWKTGLLYSESGIESLDWFRHILTGTWSAGGLTINGNSVVTTNQTGVFVITGNTGNFITASQTGQFYAATNPSQFVSTGSADIRYALATATGSFVVTGNTGNFVTASQTGRFVDTGSHQTVGGTKTFNNQTVFNYGDGPPFTVLTTSAVTNLNSDLLDGLHASSFALTSATGSFITTSQTGVFVTTGNTGNFITTSQTGVFVTTGNTGSFITTSQTGSFAPALTAVYTTGNQNITGVKTFDGGISTRGTVTIKNMNGADVVGYLNLGELYDLNNVKSAFWGDRILYDSTEAIAADWQNRRLSGNWTAQNLSLSGQSVLIGNTGSFVTTAMTGILTNTGDSRALRHLGFNLHGQTAHKWVSQENNETYYYPNVASFTSYGSTRTGAFVFNTPIHRTSFKFMRIHIKGHNIRNVGETLEDCQIFLYVNKNSNVVGNIDGVSGAVSTAFYSIIDLGTMNRVKTIGINKSGYVAVAVTTTGTVEYYDAYTADVWTSFQSPTFINTGWNWTRETGENYGFLDLRALSTGRNYVSTSQTGSFITTSQTGVFSTTGHLHTGYITTGAADLRYASIATGAFLTTGAADLRYASIATGAFLTTGAADVRYALATATGSFVTTLQTGAFAASAKTVYTTGDQIISGQKQFYDNGGVLRLNTLAAEMYDTSAIPSIEWGPRLLVNSANNVTVDWNGCTLQTPEAWTSVNWDAGLLYSEAGAVSVNWVNHILSGVWTAEGLTIKGNPVVTGSVVVDDGTWVRTTGVQVIGGPKQFTGNTLLSSSSGLVPLTVSGASGQSVNITTWITGNATVASLNSKGSQIWVNQNKLALMLGAHPGSESTYAGLWILPNGTSQSISNYTFMSNSASITYFGCPASAGSMLFTFNNVTYAAMSTVGLSLRNSYTAPLHPFSINDRYTGLNYVFCVTNDNKVGINISGGPAGALPHAQLHISGGNVAARTAPIKIGSGQLMTTPESGAIEYDGTNLYSTNGVNIRQPILPKTITLTTGTPYYSGTVYTAPVTIDWSSGELFKYRLQSTGTPNPSSLCVRPIWTFNNVIEGKTIRMVVSNTGYTLQDPGQPIWSGVSSGMVWMDQVNGVEPNFDLSTGPPTPTFAMSVMYAFTKCENVIFAKVDGLVCQRAGVGPP